MATFLRFLLTFIVGGTLLGMVAVTLAYPHYMAWDNTPAFGKALCDCAETTRQTAERLINAQLTGGAAGAGVGALVGVMAAYSRRKRKAAAAAAVAAQAQAQAPAKPT